jgi:hypothetical protein
MAVYYMNEGAFELPAGAVVRDWTTHVVQVRQGEHAMTLAVCRAHLPEGKSLRQLAQGRVLDEMARLSGYSVVGERETSWAGVPALEYASRWRHEGRAFYQQQAHLVLGGTWFFLSASTLLDGSGAVDAWFDQMRETFRLRSED